jgi:hypothetical protein
MDIYLSISGLEILLISKITSDLIGDERAFSILLPQPVRFVLTSSLLITISLDGAPPFSAIRFSPGTIDYISILAWQQLKGTTS